MDTYENKYKEAKRLYQTANADQRYVLESLFPELKESEDERIRKAIIEYLRQRLDRSPSIPAAIGSWITWLEKQGKKKYAWDEEDERIRQKFIKLVKMSSEVGGFALHKWEADEMLAWLEKQGEKKPAWSEEDEEMLTEIITDVKFAQEKKSTITDKSNNL